MRNAWFRNRVGFCATGAVLLTPFATTPANAQSLVSAYMTGVAPIAIAAGAVVFGLSAAVVLIRARQRDRKSAEAARTHLARLRAELDQAQAILEGMPEVTVRWNDLAPGPAVFGHPAAILPSGIDRDALLDFTRWLPRDDAEVLILSVARLRSAGEPFDIGITASDGRRVCAVGRAIGGAAVLRLRASTAETHRAEPSDSPKPIDCLAAERLFATLDVPALVWSAADGTAIANPAAVVLARVLGRPHLFAASDRTAHARALAQAGGATVLRNKRIGEARFDVALSALVDGYVACLVPVGEDRAPSPLVSAAPTASMAGDIGAIIDAIERPIAVFDIRGKLVRANRAYAAFWTLEENYLKPGTSEQDMLDRLRTKGQLPAVIDYREWRSKHLASYALSAPRESLWHLPDGRAVSVSAVPMSAGGVIYVFNDLTERLALETRYNALNRVQNETLNALNEGVAVFGTNGRLTLANPRLSSLWKLPINLIARHPHIDEIASTCDAATPEDGATIWAGLKQVVIDLNPTRSDRSGRLRRADGRLVDWASVRLPDGQTMLTFADVTESANYQQVLKERNDALVTADRLKDAFVQNVSYEFRSPLTSIIGFAEVLATGGLGELNDRQKAYAEYIRASSATLGVLIDNILDLATVDAGIAELELARQDVPTLIEKARSGLATTLAVGSDITPLNLRVEIDPDLPVFVADGTRIVQALYNLLSNAVRYSRDGAEIHLKVKSRGKDRILFVIEDEGTVLPEEVKATLTQRYDGTASEIRQRDAGLGLTIVRAFVNLHGGTLSVDELEPRGTRITVNLPARADALTSGAAE